MGMLLSNNNQKTELLLSQPSTASLYRWSETSMINVPYELSINPEIENCNSIIITGNHESLFGKFNSTNEYENNILEKLCENVQKNTNKLMSSKQAIPIK